MLTAEPGGDEPRPLEGESPAEYVVRSAVSKLGDAVSGQSTGVDVAADTVVVMDDRILGKPESDGEALAMLAVLRDRWHQVLTGLAVRDTRTGAVATGVETSHVRTRDYSADSIAAYVRSGEPFDKAGGYAVQDETFGPVRRVEGCYLNVVGLPLCLLLDLAEDVSSRPSIGHATEVPYYDRCVGCKLGKDLVAQP